MGDGEFRLKKDTCTMRQVYCGQCGRSRTDHWNSCPTPGCGKTYLEHFAELHAEIRELRGALDRLVTHQMGLHEKLDKILESVRITDGPSGYPAGSVGEFLFGNREGEGETP